MPNGWTFHKLFANNYRCYWHPLDKLEMYGEHIVVWQSKRYVVLPKLFEEGSAALMRYILNGIQFEEFSDHSKKFGFEGLAPARLIYDKNANMFRAKERGDIMLDYLIDTKPKPTDDEMDIWYDEHKHLQEYILIPEFYDMLTNWYNEGFFEFSA